MIDEGGIVFKFGFTGADRDEEASVGGEKFFFNFDVADLARLITSFKVGNFSKIVIDEIMINENSITFDMSGVGGFLTSRVGVGGHDLLFDDGGFVENTNNIIKTLAHFTLTVGAENATGGSRDGGFGESEDGATDGAVKVFGDVASEFNMLSLIFTNGNEVGAVKEDVGGHEDWVIKKTHVNTFGFGAFLKFVFIGVHTLHLAE